MTHAKTGGLRSSGAWYGLVLPSTGASPEADLISRSLEQIEGSYSSPGSKLQKHQPSERPLAERLYDALAAAKVMTAEVAMHLDHGWRDRLFAQLDDLLDVEDWHDDDQPLLPASFRTFLRMILHQKPERRPGLGLSHQGNLIGAWTQGNDRLTLEFLPGDIIRWTLSCDMDGGRERAAGDNVVARLPEVLSPYRPDRWFANAD